VSPALGLGPTRGDPNFVYYNLKPAQDSPPMGCLQLSQGLQRILEHDKECYDLLKSCKHNDFVDYFSRPPVSTLSRHCKVRRRLDGKRNSVC